MMTYDALNAHVAYPDVVRHWSPESERYAGGDVLNTLLVQGWNIDEEIVCEIFWHGGSRPTTIFHMQLIRDNEVMPIGVLSNPYVRRFVNDTPFHVHLS